MATATAMAADLRAVHLPAALQACECDRPLSACGSPPDTAPANAAPRTTQTRRTTSLGVAEGALCEHCPTQLGLHGRLSPCADVDPAWVLPCTASRASGPPPRAGPHWTGETKQKKNETDLSSWIRVRAYRNKKKSPKARAFGDFFLFR